MVALALRTRRQMLWAANVLMVLALGGAVWALVVQPVRVARPKDTTDPLDTTVPTRNRVPEDKLGPLEAYEVIWKRDFLKPLFPPKPAPKPPAPKPKCPVTLAGIVVEPGHGCAFLRTGTGAVKMARPGEKVEGVEVLQIAQESVTVSFEGAEFTLKRTQAGGDR